MSKHDTWAYLKTPSPYDPIKHLFPHGFPMRDPFASEIVEVDGELVTLWIVDFHRLTHIQSNDLARLIGYHCNANPREVWIEARSEGGFAMSNEWIERIEGGPECFQRLKEVADFLEAAPQPPSAEAWNAFMEDQRRRWIDGKELPPPLPDRIEEIDPRLRTPELAETMRQNRLRKFLADGDYTVLDVLLSRGIADPN